MSCQTSPFRSQEQWFPLQGLPDDTGTSEQKADTDIFTELPRFGSSFHSNSFVSIAETSYGEGTTLDDKRERLSQFHSTNFTVLDSTVEETQANSSSPAELSTYSILSTTLPDTSDSDRFGRQRAAASAAATVSAHSNLNNFTVSTSGLRHNTVPGVDDSAYLSSVLGDLSMTSLHTTPESSFFHAEQQPRAGIAAALTTGATAHTPAMPSTTSSLMRHFPPGINSTSSAFDRNVPSDSDSTLTNISEISLPAESADAGHNIDQLWRELQKMHVSTQQAGVAGAQQTALDRKCVCDHLRQLGVDTLSALVESLKVGQPCSSEQTEVQTSSRSVGTHASTVSSPCTSVTSSTDSAASHLHRPEAHPALAGPPLLPRNAPAPTHPGVGMRRPVALRTRVTASGGNPLMSPEAWQTSTTVDGCMQSYTERQHMLPAKSQLERHNLTSATVGGGGGGSDGGDDVPLEYAGGSGMPVASPSSGNWYFYPLGQLYTSTGNGDVGTGTGEASMHRRPATPARPRPHRPTIVPLSLQEAFHQQMKSFVNRSRARQHSVAVARHKRLAERQQRSPDQPAGKSRYGKVPSNRQPQTSNRVAGRHSYSSGRGRRMLHRDMIHATRQRYNSLPEVKQREEETRIERERERYRLNARRYQQRVTASVLQHSSFR